METTRRQSVSELNLEEILLAMADSDVPQPSSFSNIKPRPLPTPQARPRVQPDPAAFYHPTSYHNNDYHPSYSTETEQHLPPTADSFYTLNYSNQPQQVMYPYESSNYLYQQDPSQPGAYFSSEPGYSYTETYPYPPEQGYGEYYQEYPYPYYIPDQSSVPYPDYYPYEYQNPDYSYNQQYYPEVQQTIPRYDATVSSNFSTTRRPLPRLPPKKKREEISPGHDLTFGTPSIDSSHHLGLFPQQELKAIPQPPPKTIEKHKSHPLLPSQKDFEPQNNEVCVDSPENLAAIMADITSHFTGDEPEPSLKSSTPSRGSSFRKNISNPPSRSQSFNQKDFNSVHDHLETIRATTVPSVPSSPAPPPRLSKEAAALRLSNSSSCVSSPLVGISSKDSRAHISSAPSNLSHMSQISNSTKPAARSTTNARAFKKGPSRLASSKPQNVIQLLSSSKPVTDSDADGFDFDETDFEPIDRAVLAMSTPPECSLEQLVREYLTVNLRADWAKIRAIFIWIVDNIRYDTQLVPAVRGPSPNMLSSSDDSDDEESNSSQSIASDEAGDDEEYHETPKAVLLRRACRQHGFANLFKAMCASAGLECEVITGYLKDPNDLNELNKIPEVNHSWICVKIQGYYRFIDCGLSVSSHPYNINKRTDLFYFLTNPSKLIYTHFPTNKGHQYLRPAIPFASFALLPFATDTYFDYGIRFLDLPEGILTIHEDQTGEINLSIPDDMKCWGEVEIPDPSGRGIRRLPALVQCRTKEEGRVAKIMIRVKGKCSSALLRFRCGYPQEGKLLPYCFSLKLAHTGAKAPEEFVRILPSPVEFFLVDPLNFDLLYNIAYRFHVLPGAVESKHFKLALRSPSMKIHKFVYYPGDQGYIANVTLRERGQWAISYMVQSKEERPSKREPWINVACYRCI